MSEELSRLVEGLSAFREKTRVAIAGDPVSEHVGLGHLLRRGLSDGLVEVKFYVFWLRVGQFRRVFVEVELCPLHIISLLEQRLRINIKLG